MDENLFNKMKTLWPDLVEAINPLRPLSPIKPLTELHGKALQILKELETI